MDKNIVDKWEKAVCNLHCSCKQIEQLQEQLREDTSNDENSKKEKDIFIKIYDKTIKRNKYQQLKLVYSIIIITFLISAVYNWGIFFGIKEIQDLYITNMQKDIAIISEVIFSQKEFWIGTVCVIGYIVAMIIFSYQEKVKIKDIKKDLRELKVVNENMIVVCDLDKNKKGIFHEIFKGSGIYFIVTFLIAISQSIVAAAIFNILTRQEGLNAINNTISIERLIIVVGVILILIVLPLIYAGILITKYICITPSQKRKLVISFIMEVYKEEKIESIKVILDTGMAG